jgi:hypothetical protein
MVITGLHLVLWAEAEGRGFLGDDEKENTSGVKRRMCVLERSYQKAHSANFGKKMKMSDGQVRDAPAFRPMRHAEL